MLISQFHAQFMLSRVGRKNGGAFGDRFDHQDLAIEKFRRFATDVRLKYLPWKSHL
jgi:hypothetical protein